MNQNGSSPASSEDEIFAAAARKIAEILSSVGVTDCEMTVTLENDGARSKTLTLDPMVIDEDVVPHESDHGIFILIDVPD